MLGWLDPESHRGRQVDGQKGPILARIPKAGYDAVVCRVDGPAEVSFLVRLRQAAPRVPLVAVTPAPNPALEDLARESGADDIQPESDHHAQKAIVRIRKLIAQAQATRGRSRELRAQTRELVAEHRRIVTRNRIFSSHRIESVKRTLDHFVPLLVEDSPDQAHLMKRAFEKTHLPFPLPVMKDGAEAIEHLDGGRPPAPTLVILDVNMPRRTGLEVLAWIRSRSELTRLPVYMLTSSSHDFDRAMALGATDYFTKPSSFEGLIDVVRSITIRWWFYEQARDYRARPH
jgi:DNA-binding response OmpR family regulator